MAGTPPGSSTSRSANPPSKNSATGTATFGYRYVESDAVVDAFTDSDFGGGGTNLKGFTLGATMAVSPSVRIGLRWMSANQIAGPTLKSDILELNLNAKF